MSRAALAPLLLMAAAVALGGQEAQEKPKKPPAEKAEQAQPAPAPEAESEDAEKPKPRVYTNQDLEKAGEGGGTVSYPEIEGGPPRPRRAPPAPTAPDRRSDSREDAEDAGDEDGEPPSEEEESGGGEAHWRDRAAQARQSIDAAEARLAALEQKIAALQQDRDPTLALTTPNREQERLRRLSEAQAGLDGARSEIEAAKQALQDLRTEARRAGVPAGWLR